MTFDTKNLRAKVRVYTAPNCSQCTLTKRLMGKLGIEYAEEDATQPEAIAALKEQGYLAVPVVVAGDEHWSGFNPDRIKALAARIEQENAA